MADDITPPVAVKRENLLLLHQLPGVGNRKLMELVDRAPFLLAEPIDRNFWMYVEKMVRRVPPKSERGGLRRRIQRVIDRIERGEFRMLHRLSSGYPERLKHIYDPPLVLFVRGNEALLAADSLAVVGARNATDYGVAVARELAGRLATAGLVVVAGLARGIDSAAHVGTLKVGGQTLAVLGSGVDMPYPREARPLYRQLSEEGCVVSEFFPGTRPAPQNFPVRNRIISGLCLGVLIVEATQRSGSLITARLALEQGRELFAVPGPVHSPLSVGPNYLIKQGAKLVQVWQDVIEELPPHVQEKLSWDPCLTVEDTLESRPLADRPAAKERLTSGEEKVYNLISFDRKVHIDELLQRSGLTVGRLGRVLLNLQFKRLIHEVPGQYYLKD